MGKGGEEEAEKSKTETSLLVCYLMDIDLKLGVRGQCTTMESIPEDRFTEGEKEREREVLRTSNTALLPVRTSSVIILAPVKCQRFLLLIGTFLPPAWLRIWTGCFLDVNVLC